jgi:hypothetical protein
MASIFAKNEFRDVMVDLETLGAKPGCVILSIGAVEFAPHGLGREFYRVVNVQSCMGYGLSINTETQKWWENQGEIARTVLAEAWDPARSNTLPSVLLDFATWLPGETKSVRLWGNGATFDNAILEAAYTAAQMTYPVKFWNDMCYRTLKTLLPPKYKTIPTVPHHALEDAKAQAKDAVDMLRKLQQGGVIDET